MSGLKERGKASEEKWAHDESEKAKAKMREAAKKDGKGAAPAKTEPAKGKKTTPSKK